VEEGSGAATDDGQTLDVPGGAAGYTEKRLESSLEKRRSSPERPLCVEHELLCASGYDDSAGGTLELDLEAQIELVRRKQEEQDEVNSHILVLIPPFLRDRCLCCPSRGVTSISPSVEYI